MSGSQQALLMASSGGGAGASPHEYWRLSGLGTPGLVESLQLSDVALFSGADDQSIAWTSQISQSGTYILSDGSVLVGVGGVLSGYHFTWTFATARTIGSIRIGSHDNSNRYPSSFDFQRWNGSSFATHVNVSGITYPGNNTLGASLDVSGAAASTAFRVANITLPSGTNVELSEWAIYDSLGNRINFVLTSSVAASSGDLRNVRNMDLTDLASWTSGQSATLTLTFRFANAIAIDGCKFGTYATGLGSAALPQNVTLSYSDDGSAWTVQQTAAVPSYPGDNAWTSLINLAP